MKKAEKVPRSVEDKDIIPDYNFLFEPDGKSGKRHHGFFRTIIKENWFVLLISTFVYVLQVAPAFMLPLCTANIVDIVTESVGSDLGFTPEIKRELIINAVILTVFIFQNVLWTVTRAKMVSKLARRTSMGIKCSVVRKLQSLSITYHKDMQMGKVQSKFLKDTESIDAMMGVLVHGFIPNVMGVIISSVISICKNGYVALFFLLVIPCNVAVTFFFRKRIRSAYRDHRIKVENMSMSLTTMLDMTMITKAHGLEQQEISTVENSIKQVKNSGFHVDITSAHFGAWSWVISTFLSAVCLLFCSVLAIKKIISPGDILLFQSMFSSISGYSMSLTAQLPQLSSGLEALRSLSEIMNAQEIEINDGKADVPAIRGEVTFKNASYHYPNSDKLIVKNLNLHVKENECIAVVGSSGSGKSTLMNMIIGFLLPTDGELDIDGESISEINLSQYRRYLSVVPQNSILFAGTIRENITYGLSRYSEEDLQRAVEIANLNELIQELPDGIDSQVGEHGDRLSGGQKQRITIARALIRNPRILILDEATSALDNISEYHVQQAISKSIRGRTTFIVAHRLSTIRDADRIVVMENGEAVEIGNYEELMAKKGKFYELKALNDINMKKAEEALND